MQYRKRAHQESWKQRRLIMKIRVGTGTVYAVFAAAGMIFTGCGGTGDEKGAAPEDHQPMKSISAQYDNDEESAQEPGPAGRSADPVDSADSIVQKLPGEEKLESVEEIIEHPDVLEVDEVDYEEEVNDGEVIEDIIGVGGGGGRKFKGKYRKRACAHGARAVIAHQKILGSRNRPAHGGTHLTNDGAYDLQFFRSHGVNPMIDTDDDPLSTFAVDVDTGAFTICRSFLHDGNLPKQEAVRVEEFVNYFDYDYAPPEKGDFAAYIEGAPSPLAENRRLLAIGLKAREIDIRHRKDAVLTFVIDASGSMERENRLELVKRALRLLVDQLRPADEIGIVVYQSRGKKLLGHTPVAEGREAILNAIDRLDPGGSTNAEEGLTIGYDMADQAFREDRINRVILCSDGVANVGRTGPESILEKIREKVKKGICLTTVGFGMDNYNDLLMEQLGNQGNGHYTYVDRIEEARRVFVEGLAGTLQVIARDVKIQVAFNPERVRSYRLVGYENRAVADKDFRNDKVDGGEVGAGHAVTAIYEIKMWEGCDESLTVGSFRIRYKKPDRTEEVAEYRAEILEQQFAAEVTDASDAFRLAACVTTFAEVLRNSPWAQSTALAGAAKEAAALAAEHPGDEKIRELADLIAKADRLVKGKDENAGEDGRRVALERTD